MSRRCLSHGLGRCSCCRFLPSHGIFHLAAVAVDRGSTCRAPDTSPSSHPGSLQMLNPARPFAPHYPLLTESRREASVPFHRLQMNISWARATNQLFNTRVPPSHVQRDSLFTSSLSLFCPLFPHNHFAGSCRAWLKGKAKPTSDKIALKKG